MFWARQRWMVGSAGLIVACASASFLIPRGYALTVFCDLLPLILLAAAIGLFGELALASKGQTRLFWVLMTTGFVMWFMNAIGWTWVEVVARKPLPDPFFGDTVLFQHIVPLIAAVSLRPHR